jgi:hypothetical protein
MGRILKIVLIHVAISTLLALAFSSAGPPRPASSSTVWDSEHNLIFLTYPPKDLSGHYLSPPSGYLTRDRNRLRDELKRLEPAREVAPHSK